MKFEKYIELLVKALKPILGLNEYTGTINFPIEDGEGSAMEVKPDYKYLRYTLYVYPVVRNDYKEKRYTDIIEYTTHELSHFITEPLYDRAIKSSTDWQQEDVEIDREQATQRIANAVMRLLKANNYYPNELRQRFRHNARTAKRRKWITKVRKSNTRVSSGTGNSRSSATTNRKRTRPNKKKSSRSGK